MHQSILMNTDIHKCPEINDITDSSLKDHTFFEVFHIKYICTEYRFRHFISWITSWFFQFFYDITKSDLSNSQFLCQFFVIFDLSGNSGKFASCNILWFITQFFQKFFCRFIAFRMYTGCIQRIFATGDTSKTCTLFKGFRSQFGNFQKLTTAFKSSVFFSVSYDVLCNSLADAGNIFQKGCRGRIQVYTDFIYAVLYNTAQSLSQLLLVHIMLILTYTNRLWINLHKFCQRILKTSCNRSCTSLSYVKIREFLCSQLTCRIYRCTCFIGDHILHFLRNFFQ